MRTTEKSAAEYSIESFLAFLKKKSVVSISDLEEYYKIIGRVEDRLSDVTKSRDKWRIRAENAEAKLKQISSS